MVHEAVNGDCQVLTYAVSIYIYFIKQENNLFYMTCYFDFTQFILMFDLV